MKTSSFIARKIRFRGPLAVCAVALSFFVIIVAAAVSDGFRRDIHAALRDLSGDIIIPADSMTDSIALSSDDATSTPALYKAGIVKAGGEIRGVIFKGEPSFSSPGKLEAKIPSTLANELGIKEGDRMLTYFAGEKLKARKFLVKEVFPSVFESRETIIARVSLEDLQRIEGPDDKSLSCLEIRLNQKGLDRGKLRQKAFEMTVSTGRYCQSVCDKYSNIYDWLDLIDVNVVAILVLMIIVAGFNMISGLLILLFRSIPLVGVLKTMGMTSSRIAGVFLLVAARVTGTGMLAGNILACAFCLIQDKTRLIKLDAGNYFLSYVPADLSLDKLIVCDAVAFVSIMLILLLPCLFINRIDPAKTVNAA